MCIEKLKRHVGRIRELRDRCMREEGSETESQHMISKTPYNGVDTAPADELDADMGMK